MYSYYAERNFELLLLLCWLQALHEYYFIVCVAATMRLACTYFSNLHISHQLFFMPVLYSSQERCTVLSCYMRYNINVGTFPSWELNIFSPFYILFNFQVGREWRLLHLLLFPPFSSPFLYLDISLKFLPQWLLSTSLSLHLLCSIHGIVCCCTFYYYSTAPP